MDFQRLSRRELQALCKRNKIPANITNLAMADALNALGFVEGLEDVLITEKTSVDSPTKTEIKQSVPRTSCRTSTRRKPIQEEPQTTQISTRTRGGTRRAVAGRDEEDNNAPLDLVSRKMESQLKEAAEDDDKWAATPATAMSRRKMGTTSVREGYSTRRSTRLLEKKTTRMDLDDDQVLQSNAAKNEKLDEWVVLDKEMEIEGINQQKTQCGLVEKTDVSDEKPAVLLEDSVMGDNEEDSMESELQQVSEAFDELEDQKDVGAEVFEENEGYLDSEVTQIESHTDGSNVGLGLENVEDLNVKMELNDTASDQFEIDQEAYRAEDVIVPFLGEEKSEGNFRPNQHENEESLTLIETVDDFINTNETGPEESTITVATTHTSEGKLEAEISSVDEEVREDLSKSPGGVSLLPSEEIIACENVREEKCDQPIIISDMEELTAFEKRDQISSSHVSITDDHSEGKVSINDEISENKSLKATENTNNLPGINKENFLKENIERVKKGSTDMSIRQLRKMLKQLQITNNNTDIKEDENIFKMGRARALQPLSDNCFDGK